LIMHGAVGANGSSNANAYLVIPKLALFLRAF